MSNPSLKLTVISSERKFNMASLKELWQYRDLIRTFVFRDLVSIYKQTLLGPVWFIIQPLITTFTFTIVFGRLANIPTGGVPSILFFMSGIIYWNYFSECLIKISATFVNNAGLFSKVYFPRLAIPVALIMSNLVKFGIQLAVFAIIYIWKFPASERGLEFNYLNLLYLPLFCDS
jgi:lipopolysaccharide transport system permease protein